MLHRPQQSVGIAILMVLSSTAAMACDCTIYPFTPASCTRICNARILNKASESSLNNVLGLPKQLTDKIVTTRKATGQQLSQNDFEQTLATDDVKVLHEKLGQLDSQKVGKLKQSLEKRGKTLN